MNVKLPLTTQDSEAFAWRVTEKLPSLIAYVDRAERLVFANSAWLECYGLTREVLGRPLKELVDERLMSLWKPFMLRAFAGEAVENVSQVTTAAGEKKSFRVSRRPDYQGDEVVGYVVQATDVTALSESEVLLKRANVDLRAAQRFAENVGNCLPVRIAYWDRELRCQFVNRAYCAWHGLTLNSVLGRTHQEIFASDRDVDQRLGQLQAAIAGHAIAIEYEATSGSGQKGSFQVHLTPDVTEDGIIGVLVTSVDVTAERQAQAALQLLNSELTAARDRAEAGARAKSSFLANMSHEIRTPMNAIMGQTYLLRRASVDRAANVRLDQINDAARHLLHVVDDILDLSKIDAGKLMIDSTPFSLPELLLRCRSLVEEQAKAKGLRLVVHSAALPEFLLGDAARISQALVNLLANAVKFSEQGTVELNASVTTDGEALTLRLEVRDQGIGIDPARLLQLFEPFEQADSTTTRRFGGTGLGLALTRKLARAMGGDAQASSSPGQGSTFWFCVPVQIVTPISASLSGAFSPTDEEQLRLQHGGARILLAEDNPINQSVATSLLEAAGLIVDVADDGAQAIDMVTKANYALVLMDMQMPKVDGLAAARAIRAIAGLAHLPIVAMTANAFAEDREASIEAGMDDHLGKPVLPSLLYSTVAHWLSTKRTPALAVR